MMIALIMCNDNAVGVAFSEPSERAVLETLFGDPKRGLKYVADTIRVNDRIAHRCTLRSKRSIRREQHEKVQSTPGNVSTRVRRRRMQGDLIKLSAVAEDAELRS